MARRRRSLPSTSLHISLTLILNLPRKHTCHICLVTVSSLHQTCYKCGICNAQMTYLQRMCCLRTRDSYAIMCFLESTDHLPHWDAPDSRLYLLAFQSSASQALVGIGIPGGSEGKQIAAPPTRPEILIQWGWDATQPKNFGSPQLPAAAGTAFLGSHFELHHLF